MAMLSGKYVNGKTPEPENMNGCMLCYYSIKMSYSNKFEYWSRQKINSKNNHLSNEMIRLLHTYERKHSREFFTDKRVNKLKIKVEHAVTPNFVSLFSYMLMVVCMHVIYTRSYIGGNKNMIKQQAMCIFSVELWRHSLDAERRCCERIVSFRLEIVRSLRFRLCLCNLT